MTSVEMRLRIATDERRLRRLKRALGRKEVGSHRYLKQVEDIERLVQRLEQHRRHLDQLMQLEPPTG